jgi:hypothetical protein
MMSRCGCGIFVHKGICLQNLLRRRLEIGQQLEENFECASIGKMLAANSLYACVVVCGETIWYDEVSVAS